MPSRTPREHLKVFVIDTSRLITMAAAQVLEYLLYPGLPVILPDAVFYEATVSPTQPRSRAVLTS